MDLQTVIRRKAEEIIHNPLSIEGGHNGPYFDKETAARIIAHDIVLLCAYAKYSDNLDVSATVEILADRLASLEFRPNGFTYFCREEHHGKDKINGVVGQAWIIEGLVEAYRLLCKRHYLSVAEEVFLLHKFDKKNHIWHRIDLDGKVLSPDATFNHQLWFAAAGAMIFKETNNAEIKLYISDFVDNIIHILKLRKNGLIKHVQPIFKGIKPEIMYSLKTARDIFRIIVNKPNMMYKEIGYHSFNLYGFALLFKNYGNHPFFDSKLFQRAIDYTFSPKYMRDLENNEHNSDISSNKLNKCNLLCNRYGYGYNAVGFELPFVYAVFSDKVNLGNNANKFIEQQVKLTYDEKSNLFCKNTEDPITLSARIYEYARIVG